jgi:hypothetical protein
MLKDRSQVMETMDMFIQFTSSTGAPSVLQFSEANPIELELLILTEDMIEKAKASCKASGAFTNYQLSAVGLSYKALPKGWMRGLVGTQITRGNYEKFCTPKKKFKHKLN